MVYSYKAFDKFYDLPFNKETDLLSHKEIKRLDYVDLRDLTPEQKYDIINPYLVAYQQDVEDFGDEYKHIFFKDWCVRETCDGGEEREIRYVRFLVKDYWNEKDKEAGIDSRILSLDNYSYKPASNTFKFDTSFIVKIDHIPRLINDLKYVLDNYESIEDINLYVIPVYEYNNVSSDKYRSYKYERISDLHDIQKWTRKRTETELQYLLNALVRFAALNFKLVDYALGNKEVIITESGSGKETKSNINKYFRKAKSDKKVIMKLPGIKVLLDPSKSNVFVGTTARSICDYKFQVAGHYQHYWVGKKGNQTKIMKWVNPYFKNPDKEFKVIKNQLIKEDKYE